MTSAFLEQLMDSVDRFRQSNGSSIIDFGTTGIEGDHRYGLSSGRFRRLLDVLLEVATETTPASAFVAFQQSATGIALSLYSADSSDDDVAALPPVTRSTEIGLALASELAAAAGGTLTAHRTGSSWAVEVTLPAIRTAALSKPTHP